MKKKFEKNIIPVLFGLVFPFCSYATSEASDPMLAAEDVDGKFEEMELQLETLLSQPNLIVMGSSTPATTGTSYYPTNTSNNIVYVTDVSSSVSGIYGGYCSNTVNCETLNTNVIMSGGSVQNLYGASASVSSSTSASSIGTVYLRDSASVAHNLYGASASVAVSVTDSASRSASSIGTVYLRDSTSVARHLYGAYAESNVAADANANADADASSIGTVYLSDSASVTGNLYGAFTNAYAYSFTNADTYADASSNGTVYLRDSASVTGNLYGASAYAFANADADASSTGTVYLRDSASVAASIYGAFASASTFASASASGNVSIFGHVKLQDDRSGVTTYSSSIWGGKFGGNPTYYNVFHDNTLSLGNSPLTVQTVGNFANYNFYLNQYNQAAVAQNTALLTVTGSMQNDDTLADDGNGGVVTIKNQSTIRIAGISREGIVNQGSQVTLIDAAAASSFFGGNSTGLISGLFHQLDRVDTVNVGLVGTADVSYSADDATNTITATIKNLHIDQKRLNANVKPLAEGRLAGVQNVVRGADLLQDVVGRTSERKEPVGTLTSIAVMSTGANRYHSGSHVDARDYRVILGSRYQVTDDILMGGTLEYGHSNYDTYNDSSSGNIHGEGDTYNYGASLFSKLENDLDSGNAIYVEGALRFGRTSTKFNSIDIVTGGGETAHYNSKANYFGVNSGMGFVYAINKASSFDTSARYLWTRLGSDSVVLDGDRVTFEKSDSSRVQLQGLYRYKSSETLAFSVAGIYEYELDGKAKANVSGVSIDAPSVKGSTGIVSIGANIKPASNQRLSLDLNANSSFGRRDGAGASIRLNYAF